MLMYIIRVPNRQYTPTILIRKSYWDKTTRKSRVKTLANITKWDPEVVANLEIILKGGVAVDKSWEELMKIEKSQNHGHVACILGTIKSLGLDKMIFNKALKQRQLVLGMIAARMIHPSSKLYLKNRFAEQNTGDTLASELDIENCSEDALYRAMDWVLERQKTIESKLAKKHLRDGSIILYDLTSVYLEGKKSPQAKHGYSRDKKKGKVQIEFGLICDQEGRPISVQVFDGNTADCKTLKDQITTLKETFGLSHFVMVGDRGMITQTQIDEHLKPHHLKWITALNSQGIRKLMGEDPLQDTSSDEYNICEVRHSDYPAERLVVCFNPPLASKRREDREKLLKLTEENLDKIVESTKRKSRALEGKDKIGVRVGKVLNKYKMAKHFKLKITEKSFAYERDESSIQKEMALDGIYIIRSNLSEDHSSSAELVEHYKRLSLVEQSFRSMKSISLEVRPIRHWTENRVKAHVFLCMLAYYVEWEMKQKLAPLLFKDDAPEEAKESRESIVHPAAVSSSAKKKTSCQKNENGLLVQSWEGLLHTLSTLSRVTQTPKVEGAKSFTKLTEHSCIHTRAFELLGLKFPRC